MFQINCQRSLLNNSKLPVWCRDAVVEVWLGLTTKLLGQVEEKNHKLGQTYKTIMVKRNNIDFWFAKWNKEQPSMFPPNVLLTPPSTPSILSMSPDLLLSCHWNICWEDRETLLQTRDGAWANNLCSQDSLSIRLIQVTRSQNKFNQRWTDNISCVLTEKQSSFNLEGAEVDGVNKILFLCVYIKGL